MGRTKAGSLPAYQLHKASGKAVVTINYRDIYLGDHGSPESKAEYARIIVEYASTGEVKRQRASEQSLARVVIEILAAYWEFAQAYYLKDGKPTEEQKALRKVIRDVRTVCGDLPVDEVGPKVIKAIRQRWIDEQLCRGYINQNTGRVCRIFKWAVSEELVSSSVYESLRTVTGLRKGRSLASESVPIPPVSIQVVQRTIPHLSSVVADMIRFQLLTGARPGEVCKIRPCDIDRSGDVWEYHVEGHKMEHHDRSRVIYVGPEAQAIISPYLLRESTTCCFSPAESVAELRERRSLSRKTPPSCGNARGRKRDNGGLRGNSARWKPGDSFTTGSYGQAIKRGCDIAFPAPEPLAKTEAETIAQHRSRLTAKQLAELESWQKSQRWAPNQLRHTRGTERPHPATLHRWEREGLRGVKLRTAYAGGHKRTCRQWIREFFDEINSVENRQPLTPSTTSGREAEIESARQSIASI